MRLIDLHHSRSYVVVMPDPMTARFDVAILPCREPSCVDARSVDHPICCRAMFVPLTGHGVERLERDAENQVGHDPSEWTDIEKRLLGEVLEEIVVLNDGAERSIRVLRLIPMIVRPCVASALFEVYIRTVPSVVDLMESVGVHLPTARSILDRGDARPVRHDQAHVEAPEDAG